MPTLFGPLLNVIKNAQTLSIDYVMQELFKDKQFTDYIILLNTKSQLYDKGVRSDGIDITPFYSRNTLNIKAEKGQIVDHVTLKDTGAFYRSFQIFLNSNNDFQITADTLKGSTDLLKKYGQDVLGLTEQSLELLVGMAKPKIRVIVRKKLNI